ncbi:peptidoglycan-binding protein [Pseudooceanicola sp. CBS1P-1]|uniref:Peptidoglycan-binding protein n=1 Tax=Pseudooceanicola albus TaxID=2692189 RepID=A0A6L7GBC7_9RHOB|nr:MULTISPECIES: glycoside hydrolase family 19 protein [Pseudooceanicola]MBT9386547.1 peptidoglycan-binding protein [Pseudooceanicola endophyticus]MXN20580.1 peptidoglycan-binding protein [Pseudooceanicola albus]
MPIIDEATLFRMAGGAPDPANVASVCAGLEMRGRAFGLAQPHQLACYLAQLLHESAGLRHDREIWGPTAAQKRYEQRTDLGNSAALDGDGFLYRGRGAIQITGKDNYRAFRDWARREWRRAPDFVAEPDAVLLDPWEGLVPIWYWESRNLQRYATAGDMEMLTRRINGGLNGYADRLACYVRVALVLLDRAPGDITGFQAGAGLEADGIAGPRTRAALHQVLCAQPERGRAPAGAPWLSALLGAVLSRFDRSAA